MNNQLAVEALKAAQQNIAADRHMCDEQEGFLWDHYQKAIDSLSAPLQLTDEQILKEVWKFLDQAGVHIDELNEETLIQLVRALFAEPKSNKGHVAVNLGEGIASSVTVELSELEAEVLDGFAARQDLSRSAVMRQALRYYQMESIATPFWQKHALGSLARPSCFKCGSNEHEAAIKHLELPNIYICTACASNQPPIAPLDGKWKQRAAELVTELEALDVPDILLKQITHLCKMANFLRELAVSPVGSEFKECRHCGRCKRRLHKRKGQKSWAIRQKQMNQAGEK